MKKSQIKYLSIFFFVTFLGMACSDVLSQVDRSDILAVTQKDPVVKAFYQFANKYHLAECVVSSVEISCDSQWVTCRENAWVVSYKFKDHCVNDPDERLTLHVVIDAENLEKVSIYPEAEFFANDSYCYEDYECESSADRCVNFLHGAVEGLNNDGVTLCQCQEYQCRIKG